MGTRGGGAAKQQKAAPFYILHYRQQAQMTHTENMLPRTCPGWEGPGGADG